MRKKRGLNKAALVHRHSVRIRFSEVDSMNIVWHGNYVKLFEDGREAFGNHYGIGYLDIYGAGYTAPVVELHCSYIQPLTYGDTAVIETRYIYLPSAKVRFEYDIFRESDNALVATGYSLQVFLDKEGALEWNNPEFFLNWQKRWMEIE
ncbi:MAG: 4-hydroxybenzoyl-CoA thioesterase [Bacteroidetes bacterium HGW-Bacteroidetes-10]|jgi:acyl-CoA thioester hydrolase|nr:MAG: 4-hydroxybenzoyl-CoA thioesterase [Bacteroidetes bacterium HGW-Bacteroidetes-10]